MEEKGHLKNHNFSKSFCLEYICFIVLDIMSLQETLPY
jgi:hypothetical protein